jgi:uncharacterized SAM-binding protein YcdF (DUF218 family)
MHHELRPTDVGIGLGSHDLGVATYAAELYHSGMFPLIVFTGANAPTKVERFPRGEAVHYREHALELGVPDDAILIETEARNTGDNVTLTRKLLADSGIPVNSVTLISRLSAAPRLRDMQETLARGRRHLRIPSAAARRLYREHW